LGMSFGDNVQTPRLTLIACNNNVILAPQGQITGMFVVNRSQIDGPASISNNFLDIEAVTGSVFQFGGTGSITVSNNINMRTGLVIPPP